MTYTIATWNRPHHTIAQSRHDLEAIVPAERFPDILALQECKRSDDTLQTAWSGLMDSKGFGISVRPDWSVQHGSMSHDSRSVRPFVVRTHNGPLHVLVVWAHLEPTYVDGIMKGLKANDEFLRAAPSIVLGDFNSHPRFDRSALRHDSITQYLEEQHALVSAYHAYNACTPGNEQHSTYYHQYKLEQPFHIDYCFLPKSLCASMRMMSIGTYEEFDGHSDHRPLFVVVGREDLDAMIVAV